MAPTRAEECLLAHLCFAPWGWWNLPLILKVTQTVFVVLTIRGQQNRWKTQSQISMIKVNLKCGGHILAFVKELGEPHCHLINPFQRTMILKKNVLIIILLYNLISLCSLASAGARPPGARLGRPKKHLFLDFLENKTWDHLFVFFRQIVWFCNRSPPLNS
jgi:hypothetical protein